MTLVVLCDLKSVLKHYSVSVGTDILRNCEFLQGGKDQDGFLKLKPSLSFIRLLAY